MKSPEATGWDRGWDGHELAQRRRLAALTLIEKLQWLEEAHDLVRNLSQPQPQPARQTDPRKTP